ncbi:MAG TPA: hypothetical protein VFL83_13525 [Anaeromyxobacter sp.]|nr:hypothetical protein [Anaeromyxobacter sp.]
MNVPRPERRFRVPPPIALLALAVLAAAPRSARALRLLDGELSLEGGRARAPLVVALAAAPPSSSLDFDLLGKPTVPAPSKDDARMGTRRKLLHRHQQVGLGVLGLEIATIVAGQLNYSDKFGTANTGRYELSHKALAYTTFGVFAVGGTLALLAPRPAQKPDRGWDRVRVHKLGMLLATAGMVAQAVYGIQTRNREGYLDQEQIGKTHLIIGYGTLAATGVAVGALVF